MTSQFRLPITHRLPALVFVVLLFGACGGGNSGDNTTNDNTTNGNEQPECGDGVMASNEECDNGALNSDTVVDACRLDCLTAYCGDGVTDSNEECDGGDFCDGLCVPIDSAEVRISYVLRGWDIFQPLALSCAEAGVATLDFWIYREAQPIDEMVFELLGAPCDDLPITVADVDFANLFASVAAYDATSMFIGNGQSWDYFIHQAAEGTDASLVVEF